MAFKLATKEKPRARIALIGPSGSGKTFSALRIARGLVGPQGKIAIIDSERGSASKYADRFRFSVDDLETFHPDAYINSLMDAGIHGFDCVIIDSLSHAWMGKDGALEQVDKAAARSKTGNSFGAWREVTPMHNALVDAILRAPFHIIATMRAKTEYLQEKNADGRTEIRKVGLAPVQRDGMEYEFDVVGDMDLDNRLLVSKSRCPSLTKAVIKEPGEDLGVQLAEWLSGPTAEDVITYVQSEADLCFTPDDVSGLKRLLLAKGGAYFTEQVKDILKGAMARIAPPAAPAAAQVQAEYIPPLVDPATEPKSSLVPTLKQAMEHVEILLRDTSNRDDFDRIKGVCQNAGGVYLEPQVVTMINARYFEVFPEESPVNQSLAQKAA